MTAGPQAQFLMVEDLSAVLCIGTSSSTECSSEVTRHCGRVGSFAISRVSSAFVLCSWRESWPRLIPSGVRSTCLQRAGVTVCGSTVSTPALEGAWRGFVAGLTDLFGGSDRSLLEPEARFYVTSFPVFTLATPWVLGYRCLWPWAGLGAQGG